MEKPVGCSAQSVQQFHSTWVAALCKCVCECKEMEHLHVTGVWNPDVRQQWLTTAGRVFRVSHMREKQWRRSFKHFADELSIASFGSREDCRRIVWGCNRKAPR